MSAVEPRVGEKIILQEDCAEDKLKNGLLTLTNQRLLFERTEGTLATLSKKTGQLLLDIPLNKIRKSTAEGFIIKKVVVYLHSGEIFKFGVLSTGKWAKQIESAMSKTI